jgi:hypothetical protein
MTEEQDPPQIQNPLSEMHEIRISDLGFVHVFQYFHGLLAEHH